MGSFLRHSVYQNVRRGLQRWSAMTRNASANRHLLDAAYFLLPVRNHCYLSTLISYKIGKACDIIYLQQLEGTKNILQTTFVLPTTSQILSQANYSIAPHCVRSGRTVTLTDRLSPVLTNWRQRQPGKLLTWKAARTAALHQSSTDSSLISGLSTTIELKLQLCGLRPNPSADFLTHV